MAEDRRSAIGNERVGARLGRLFQRNRTQEEQDVLEAYRRQIPVDEVRRRRAAASTSGMRSGDAEGSNEAATAMREAAPAPSISRTQPRMGDAEGSDEAAAVLRERQQRPRPRPNTRLSPRPARAPAVSEVSANDLNAISLARGEGSDSPAAENIRRRLAEMGGSGDIGAASARARGEQVGPPGDYNMKKGGKVAVKKMKAGGVVKSSASSRGDGCAARGKTKGRMV